MKGKNLAGTRSARRRQAAGLLLVVPLLLVLSLAGCRQEHKAAAPAVPVVEVVLPLTLNGFALSDYLDSVF